MTSVQVSRLALDTHRGGIAVLDADGNVTAFIDKLGQRWSKIYDRLDRVVAESDPLVNTKRISYDPAGRIKQISEASRTRRRDGERTGRGVMVHSWEGGRPLAPAV